MLRGSILVVDDDADTATLACDALRKRGFDATPIDSGEACLRRLQQTAVDIVVSDVDLGAGMTGIALCKQIADTFTDTLPIIITGSTEIATAIAAIQAGAYDYVTKPLKVDVLAIAVGRALEYLGLLRELRQLRQHSSSPQHGVVGTSPAIRQTLDVVARVAASDVTVLITGESGTGKELVARALHDQSPRHDAPFVAINCAAMPAPLLESELFGHVRGAFTDARDSRAGLFIQAGAGTILLDEIGEMPMEMQVKLLRVLQERTVRPVGGDVEVPVKARVVTATNRDLEHEVEEKRFREDLFYRINVVPIAVPPLRSRTSDILPLAQFFLDRIAKRTKKQVEAISPAAARLLLDYDWPGNVRELENCMERAVALSKLSEITIDDLPATLTEQRPGELVIASASPSELLTLDQVERRYVRQVLAATNGNKTHAAKVLGIDRRSLYRRLEAPQAGETDEPTAEP
ncbi:MAG TPA: sigma-54 dependent transcriptional regulator [Kofleriaceae bacterium]